MEINNLTEMLGLNDSSESEKDYAADVGIKFTPGRSRLDEASVAMLQVR